MFSLMNNEYDWTFPLPGFGEPDKCVYGFKPAIERCSRYSREASVQEDVELIMSLLMVARKNPPQWSYLHLRELF